MASRYSGGRSQRYAAEFGTKTETVSPEEKEAQAAGFSSVSAQTQNRIMRNQLEEKATRLGVPLADAYALAGSDLTNTQALQEAWNKLTGPPADPPTGGGDEEPSDPFNEQIKKLTEQFDAYRKESQAALDAANQKVAQMQSDMARQQSSAEQQRRETELQRQLAIQSQVYSERQAQQSAERGGAQARLKIASDSRPDQAGGTSAFKRRRDRLSIAPLQTTAGINAPARSVLNV